MTNREMLMVIKDAAPSLEHIKEIAEKIISKTRDIYINNANYINVTETDVTVGYDYSCRGEWGNEEVIIPIEWFDEEFDYVKAYEEILRKEEANRKRAEKARLKRAAEKRKQAKELKEKKEYDKYLKLKEKYESKG
jgi:NurA-like 5'-3' nuclease